MPRSLSCLLYPEDADDTTAAARPSPPEHGARHIEDDYPETTVQKREVPRSNAPYTLTKDDLGAQSLCAGRQRPRESYVTVPIGKSFRLMVRVHIDDLQTHFGVRRRYSRTGAGRKASPRIASA